MNAKEMEQALIDIRSEMRALTATMQGAVTRDAEDLNQVRTDINGLGAALNEVRHEVAQMNGRAAAYDASMDAIRKLVRDTADAHREDLIEMISQSVNGVTSRVETLENGMMTVVLPEIKHLGEKVHATNRSAPSKRNMTDEDALKVLTGEFKDLSHKDAGEKIGLTYAQVYSCRGEFTFKHVHKELRDGGWKNPWVK